ncbi:MAG: response regulator transcription factor [Dehalococcoidia bacterium]|nr:response regulator transcription factor [Dehalococcoidia bacterium]
MEGGVPLPSLSDYPLHLSLATVRNHIQSILSKLGVHTALEAVAFSTKHGLL